MKIGSQIITCSYDSTITDAVARANTETTGYAAVSLVLADNESTAPVPQVKLAATATESVYGALITVNTATQRCGVATGGIIPIRKNAGYALGDIGMGVKPTTTAGQVEASSVSDGRGTVVAGSGNILFVDLDVNASGVT